MTGKTQAVDRGHPEPAGPVAAAIPEAAAREFDDAPCWPVTRLMGWSLTLALGVSIFGPTTAAHAHRIEWLTLLLPAALGTLGARALFEALGFAMGSRGPAAGWRGFRGLLAAAIPAALLAATLMALASVIVGVAWSPVVGATTTALAALVLTTAGAIRGVEIRLRLSLRRVFFVGSAESQRDLERELARRSDARLVGARTAVMPPVGSLTYGQELGSYEYMIRNPATEDGEGRHRPPRAEAAGPANAHDAAARPARHPGARSEAKTMVETVLTSRATLVVLDAHAMRVPELVDAASQLNLAGLRIRDLVSYYESEFKKVPLSELSPTWFLFDIASIHRRRIYSLFRRGLEALVGAVLLLLSLPVLLVAAALIKLTSRGPVLYRQRRVGKGGVAFTLVKLRTMAESPEPSAAEWAPSHAHRVTKVGGVLRRFRLDEVPQLWNVIRGDLALVGPRPEQVPIVERLDRELPHYSARHCIRPGITGWAQVNLGYAGSVEGTMAKLQRDLYYVKHNSLRLDGLIIWLTIKTVIAGRG
jgi:lipopolysaccharide/colanic/teichoic acid biosynthesis glycosyltransferase